MSLRMVFPSRAAVARCWCGRFAFGRERHCLVHGDQEDAGMEDVTDSGRLQVPGGHRCGTCGGPAPSNRDNCVDCTAARRAPRGGQ